ncbi:MAG: tRNA epoxyqueuosine(34) reductase QueG [Desulfitobacterium sp.]|nr:tRNA epoxyqueuosine(34) reductase QueG [Desulfitobacterium sp.]
MESREGLKWKEIIRELAYQSGFVAVGFTNSEPIAGLEEFLAKRNALGYNTPFEKSEFSSRVDPKAIWSACKTVVTLAYPLPLTKKPQEGEGVLARSAVGEDYHRVLKKALEKLITSMNEVGWEGESQLQVDTGPLNERAFAVRAGLGWIGKNQQLIIPKVGSFVALALMLLDRELPPDKAPHANQLENKCGECTRCIEVCPPQILGQKNFQANKCLSYLTQSKEPLTRAQTALIGTRIFGCDTCQEACPHNQPFLKRELEHLTEDVNQAKIERDELPNNEDEFLEEGLYRDSEGLHRGTGEILSQTRKESLSRGVDLWQTLNLTKSTFNQEWRNSAAGWRGKGVLQRNAYLALCNLKDPRGEEWIRRRKEEDTLGNSKIWVIIE